MARNQTLKQARNEAIKAMYTKLTTKNNVSKKYRNDYLLQLVANKFYLQPRAIYQIIRQK